jgi:hypothetical protein
MILTSPPVPNRFSYYSRASMVSDETKSVIKHNRRLDGRLVADALERLAELLQLEGLVDDTLRLDLARVEVVDRLGWVVSIWLVE